MFLGPELELMMLFEMMTDRWMLLRLAKYLKMFTDVQQFAYLVSNEQRFQIFQRILRLVGGQRLGWVGKHYNLPVFGINVEI